MNNKNEIPALAFMNFLDEEHKRREQWKEEYPALTRRMVARYSGNYFFGELLFHKEIHDDIDRQIQRMEHEPEYKNTLEKQNLIATLQGYSNDIQ